MSHLGEACFRPPVRLAQPPEDEVGRWGACQISLPAHFATHAKTSFFSFTKQFSLSYAALHCLSQQGAALYTPQEDPDNCLSGDYQTQVFIIQPLTFSSIFASSSRIFSHRAASSAALGLVPPSASRLVICIQSRGYAKSRSKMAPKKPAVEEKIPLGRPGNSLKSGIVCCT